MQVMQKVKKGKLFVGGLAAGVLAFGMGGAVGASSYDYGTGSDNSSNYGSDSSSDYSSSASYEQSSSYKETTKSSSYMSCNYGAQYRYDSSRNTYDWMWYNTSNGVWYSCESASSFEHSIEAASMVKASYDVNASSQNSDYGSNEASRW